MPSRLFAVVAAILIDKYNATRDVLKQQAAEQVLKSNRAAVPEIFAYNSKSELIGTGSGLFISSDGTLITNLHVIEDAP